MRSMKQPITARLQSIEQSENIKILLAWTGTQFIAVGTGGTILTSPDGASWTARTSGKTTNLHGIVWSGSKFVAVGDNGTILTSP